MSTYPVAPKRCEGCPFVGRHGERIRKGEDPDAIAPGQPPRLHGVKLLEAANWGVPMMCHKHFAEHYMDPEGRPEAFDKPTPDPMPQDTMTCRGAWLYREHHGIPHP